ncbi:potassium-transporting ATPase subunit F [Ferroacidibacillus organovorans]
MNGGVDVENWVLLTLSIVVMLYLVFVIVRPEKF